MFYEEGFFQGAWWSRSTPNGKWEPMSAEQLNAKINRIVAEHSASPLPAAPQINAPAGRGEVAASQAHVLVPVETLERWLDGIRWHTTNSDGSGDEWNNDDVIEVCDEISALLAAAPKEQA